LHVKVTIDPKDADAFLSHFQSIYDLVLAEPECAYFIFGQNIQEPGVFRWTEGWTKDPQWFMTVINPIYNMCRDRRCLQRMILNQEQMTKEYYKPYHEATEPMFTNPR
jgi:quinol monooxygenase YgiN